MAGLLFRLFREMEVTNYFSREDALADMGFLENDQIVIEWNTGNNPVTNASYAYTVGAGNTVNTLIAAFGDPTRAYWNASGDPTINMFTRISYVPRDTLAGSTVRHRLPFKQIDISRARVYIKGDSCMKIQNRSINSGTIASNQSDQIDNSPVIGKMYNFNGSIAYQGGIMRPLVIPIAADGTTGTVNLVSGTSGGLPREPPSYNYFRNCKAGGGAVIDPGAIKVSYLSGKMGGSLNYILDKLSGYANANFRTTPFGKMRVFAFEKMINSDNAQPIRLFCEVNTTWSVTVSLPKTFGVKPTLITA